MKLHKWILAMIADQPGIGSYEGASPCDAEDEREDEVGSDLIVIQNKLPKISEDEIHISRNSRNTSINI